MKSLFSSLSGYKTYTAAAGMVLYAIIGQVLQLHDADQSMSLFMQALAIAGLRNSIK